MPRMTLAQKAVAGELYYSSITRNGKSVVILEFVDPRMGSRELCGGAAKAFCRKVRELSLSYPYGM